MAIPRKLRVGAFTYAVGRAAAPDLGHCDADNLRINISPHQEDDQARCTLLHELLHAIANKTGIDKRWGDDEEFYVTLLGDEIFALLRGNPNLVAWIME